MKTVFLLAFLLAGAALPLHGQQWFQNHPHWANAYSVGFVGPGFEYVTVAGDTLLQGLPAVVLKREHDLNNSYYDFVDRRVARQNGDTVWVWNHKKSAFYIQYNFSLAAGDSVVGPYVWGDVNFRYYIDSIGTLNVNGHLLRFQQVHPYTGYDFFQCKNLIIETIGFINGECINTNTGYHSRNSQHLMIDEPNHGVVDGVNWAFCQFYNDLLIYSSNPACKGLDDQQGSAALSPFQVQPNPFHNTFSIVSLGGRVAGQLRIFNIAGRLMWQNSSPFDPVSTAHWPTGLYLFEITSPAGQRQFYKALKE